MAGQEISVSLALDLDRGCAEWKHVSAAYGRIPSVVPSTGGLTTTFTGRVVRQATVPFLDNSAHHKEFLLECGIPITAFSADLSRGKAVVQGDWIEGTGYLFGHVDGSGLTLVQRVRARVEEVREPFDAELPMKDDWLVIRASTES